MSDRPGKRNPRRYTRRGSEATQTLINSATIESEGTLSNNAKTSYKLDYPIEVLGPSNFPAFFQGFTSYQGAKKAGGPDLKFYLTHNGTYPDIFGEVDRLPRTSGSMPRRLNSSANPNGNAVSQDWKRS